MEIETSDIFAAGALVVSVASLFLSIKRGREQSSLTVREVELVRILIEKEQREHQEQRKALVSARIIKKGKGEYRLRVFNLGPAEARNVLILPEEDSTLIHLGSIESKFPMDRMEKGQSVEVLAHVFQGTKQKEKLVLKWEDDYGFARENSIEITI